jgi:hypothetical protein
VTPLAGESKMRNRVRRTHRLGIPGFDIPPFLPSWEVLTLRTSPPNYNPSIWIPLRIGDRGCCSLISGLEWLACLKFSDLLNESGEFRCWITEPLSSPTWELYFVSYDPNLNPHLHSRCVGRKCDARLCSYKVVELAVTSASADLNGGDRFNSS